MTTLAEPEWDAPTRDLAMALDAVETCPICGGPSALCQDPANQYAWEVPAPVRCHRTTALLEQQEGYTEKTNPHLRALAWSTQLRTNRVGR